jgi:hypothetical protein
VGEAAEKSLMLGSKALLVSEVALVELTGLVGAEVALVELTGFAGADKDDEVKPTLDPTMAVNLCQTF